MSNLDGVDLPSVSTGFIQVDDIDDSLISMGVILGQIILKGLNFHGPSQFAKS